MPQTHMTTHKRTHTLSLLLALFLCFLSSLGCRTFRFLHLFIGFVISGLRLLLESKHRICNNKETVSEALIISEDDAFEKYLVLLYTHNCQSVSVNETVENVELLHGVYDFCMCFLSLFKSFLGMSELK